MIASSRAEQQAAPDRLDSPPEALMRPERCEDSDERVSQASLTSDSAGAEAGKDNTNKRCSG